MGVKFGMEEEEGTFGPLLHAKFHPHRCNVSPLRGEKPQNWPLSKLNTGRFALRAMLPVTINVRRRIFRYVIRLLSDIGYYCIVPIIATDIIIWISSDRLLYWLLAILNLVGIMLLAECMDAKKLLLSLAFGWTIDQGYMFFYSSQVQTKYGIQYVLYANIQYKWKRQKERERANI